MAFLDESTSKQDFRLKLFTTNKTTEFFLELILTISQPEKMSKNVKLCQILKKLNMQNYKKL